MTETVMPIDQLSIDFKDACRAATTANITTILTGAPDVVDGFNVSANDRVLVKDQTSGDENGIYRIVSVGTGSNGVWERVEDFNSDVDISQGIIVPVIKGTTQTKTFWILMTPDPITLDTTALDFQQIPIPDGGGGGGVFGTEYESDEETGDTSTTSTSFQEHHTFTTADLPAGTYRIGWFYVWRATKEKYAQIRVQLDNSNNLVTPLNFDGFKAERTDIRKHTSGFAEVVLSAGTHQIDIDLRAPNGGTAYLYNSRIEIWKVE